MTTDTLAANSADSAQTVVPSRPPVRSLAYLVGQYPMLSMIFVLREVVQLREMGFRIDGQPTILMLAVPPAAQDRYIGFTPSKPASPTSIMMFHVTSVPAAQKSLQAQGLYATEASGAVTTKDPDGNLIEFTTATAPKL